MLLFEFRRMKEQIKERMDINNEGLKLKLQALERLTVFAERAGLKNLIGRVETMQMSAAGLHASTSTPPGGVQRAAARRAGL